MISSCSAIPLSITFTPFPDCAIIEYLLRVDGAEAVFLSSFLFLK